MLAWIFVSLYNSPSLPLRDDTPDVSGFFKTFNSEHRELYSNMGMRIEYTISLMMRLKSFRPEIDKKLAAPERMPKI